MWLTSDSISIMCKMFDMHNIDRIDINLNQHDNQPLFMNNFKRIWIVLHLEISLNIQMIILH